MKISIVIPSYNEENRIKKTLNSYTKLLDKDSEIIVVCNGCKDKTPIIVKEFSQIHKNVKLLDFKEKIGKGGAVIEGFKIAKGKTIGFVDADDAFDANQVLELANETQYYDCAIASKWLDKNFLEVKEHFTRKIFSRCWNLLIRFFLGLNFKDTQGGTKFIKKEALDKILNKLQCKGFEFDVEILYALKSNGYKIKEKFLDYEVVEGSTFSLKHAPIMFLELVKIRLRNYK